MERPHPEGTAVVITVTPTPVAQGLTSHTNLKEETTQVFSLAELEKLQVALELDEASLKLLLNSLTFILKQAAFHVAKPAVLREQLITEGLTEEKASAIAQVWVNVAKPTLEALRQHSLCPLQLESVKSSLNARVSSSSQTGQHTALARLQLMLSNQDNPSQAAEPVTLELDHGELYQLYNQLEKVQAQLDALK
ncbi:hypothetical protein B566_EDAN012902 [Ephemera danica]|nr:hypothetical protein B566_EDAN012902 [Ephemera danica]